MRINLSKVALNSKFKESELTSSKYQLNSHSEELNSTTTLDLQASFQPGVAEIYNLIQTQVKVMKKPGHMELEKIFNTKAKVKDIYKKVATSYSLKKIRLICKIPVKIR